MTDPLNGNRLALNDMHAAAGATFVESAGWWLPAHYGDPIGEHRAIRESAAVIDGSSSSRLLVTGPGSGGLVQRVFGDTIVELHEAEAIRAVALDDQGLVRDFAVVARTGTNSYLVLGAPGQRSKTAGRLRAAASPEMDARVDDRTETTCMVGLVGPEAAAVMSKYLSDGLPERLPGMHCIAFEALGFRALAIRISDTGEDGFAMMLAPGVARHTFESVRAAGVPLAGEIGRTIARVEACIPAFSPDLEFGLTPAEADLAGLVSAVGGPVRRMLSALLLDGEGDLPVGTPVTVGSTAIGEVRSCLRSPLLGSTIALGVVEAHHSLPGIMLEVAGRPARVVTKPFYRRRN